METRQVDVGSFLNPIKQSSRIIKDKEHETLVTTLERAIKGISVRQDRVSPDYEFQVISRGKF
jgi:hypothetical protein